MKRNSQTFAELDLVKREQDREVEPAEHRGSAEVGEQRAPGAAGAERETPRHERAPRRDDHDSQPSRDHVLEHLEHARRMAVENARERGAIRLEEREERGRGERGEDGAE